MLMHSAAGSFLPGVTSLDKPMISKWREHGKILKMHQLRVKETVGEKLLDLGAKMRKAEAWEDGKLMLFLGCVALIWCMLADPVCLNCQCQLF